MRFAALGLGVIVFAGCATVQGEEYSAVQTLTSSAYSIALERCKSVNLYPVEISTRQLFNSLQQRFVDHLRYRCEPLGGSRPPAGSIAAEAEAAEKKRQREAFAALQQREAATLQLAKEMRIPPQYAPSWWGENVSPSLAMTDMQWVITDCYLGGMAEVTMKQCPKTFRFLPQGSLAVSPYEFLPEPERKPVYPSIKRGAPRQYGPAMNASWAQQGNKFYLYYKITRDLQEIDVHVYATIKPDGVIEAAFREVESATQKRQDTYAHYRKGPL